MDNGAAQPQAADSHFIPPRGRGRRAIKAAIVAIPGRRGPLSGPAGTSNRPISAGGLPCRNI